MEFWLKTQVKQNGNKVFIDDGLNKITFASMYYEASRLAYQIKQLKKKRIGIYIENHIESITLINALWLAGVEIVMLNTRLTKEEIQNQLHSIETDTVITTTNLTLQDIVIIDFDVLKREVSNNTYEAIFNMDQIASIMFTSGTTGPQKAVPQTFGNHYASALGCKQSLGFNQDTKWLSVLPIYHISGLSVIIRALIQGFTVRIAAKFNSHRMLEIIEKELPTHVSLVPQTLKWLMDEGLTQPYNIQKILLGGAKLSSTLIEKALKLGLPIYNSFGMTETCSQFLTASPSMLAERYDTVGKPSENVFVKIKEPNNLGHGELLIKGDNVMNGYLYPEDLIDTFENGYFKTGDIAEIDDDGYVMIYDRRKDLIISGGENIYPYQLESVAKLHESITDAMCIGEHDSTWGEVPYLYYVSKTKLSNETLIEHFKSHIAKYKIPKYFKQVTELPYTSTGKLQRKHLKN